MDLALSMVDKGLVPAWLIRLGIRCLLKQRKSSLMAGDPTSRTTAENEFVADLRTRSIAEQTDAANEQHYEVPPDFFKTVLGARLKYSCCLYENWDEGLDRAEENMLEYYVRLADLRDGQRVLDLGCGWGSLSLFLAAKFPGSTVTGVSNSAPQRDYIMAQAKVGKLTNLEIITADMNTFDAPATYDRVCSVEMFEHMKNYETLLARVSSWLVPGGKLMVHIFTCALGSYHFEVADSRDWMAQYFFSGGTMPSTELLLRFQTPGLSIQSVTGVSGEHYSRTLEDWLVKLDANRARVRTALLPCYKEQTEVWIERWRVFLLSCSELFAIDEGRTWPITIYVWNKV